MVGMRERHNGGEREMVGVRERNSGGEREEWYGRVREMSG